MNLLTVAQNMTVPADSEWVQGCDDRDDPDGRLRTLLDSAWHAVSSMKGTEVVAATAILRHAFQQRDRFRDFPCDEVETLLAMGRLWEDDIDEAVLHAQSVLMRGTGTRYRPALAVVMKFCSWRTRDFKPFYDSCRGKAPRSNAISLLVAIINLSIEAAAEAEQLRFKLAERLARDALFLCEKMTKAEAYASLFPTCILAQLHYEAGTMDEADALLRGRLTAIEDSGAVESALIAYVLSAKIAAARGNQNIALLILRRGEDVGIQRRWSRLVLRCKAEEVALHIHDGRADLAELALEELQNFVGELDAKARLKEVDTWPLQMASLRLQMANGPSISTTRALDDLRDTSLHHNHPALVVKLTMLLSSALYSIGNVARAQEELLAALQQGANAGLFRTFLDDMPLIEGSLKLLWRSPETKNLGHLGPYIGQLLTATSTPPLARKNSARITGW
jgi:hypothetical protein